MTSSPIPSYSVSGTAIRRSGTKDARPTRRLLEASARAAYAAVVTLKGKRGLIQIYAVEAGDGARGTRRDPGLLRAPDAEAARQAQHARRRRAGLRHQDREHIEQHVAGRRICILGITVSAAKKDDVELDPIDVARIICFCISQWLHLGEDRYEGAMSMARILAPEGPEAWLEEWRREHEAEDSKRAAHELLSQSHRRHRTSSTRCRSSAH